MLTAGGLAEALCRGLVAVKDLLGIDSLLLGLGSPRWAIPRPVGWQRLWFGLQGIEPAAFVELRRDPCLALPCARPLIGNRLAGLAQLIGAWRELPPARQRDLLLNV